MTGIWSNWNSHSLQVGVKYSRIGNLLVDHNKVNLLPLPCPGSPAPRYLLEIDENIHTCITASLIITPCWKQHNCSPAGERKIEWRHAFSELKAEVLPTAFATPWSVAHQAPLSMEFSRQEYQSGLPFPSPGDLPNPGIEPRSPALQTDS